MTQRLNAFIDAILSTSIFRKAYFYFRCMKKAPHNGVFCNKRMGMFIKHYSCDAFIFLRPCMTLPEPLLILKELVLSKIKEFSVSESEVLWLSFGTKSHATNDPIFGEQLCGSKHYAALTSNTLSLKDPSKNNFSSLIDQAVMGTIDFQACFNVDYSRLIEVFICLLLSLNPRVFNSIEDILAVEDLNKIHDKYGLTDIIGASFARQGFYLNNQYYLYNILFDTSIGSANGTVPRTIELINDALLKGAHFYMRCDNTLCVPENKSVCIAPRALQKWHGISLDFDTIQSTVFGKKEIIVHGDETTLHKVLITIKKETAADGKGFFQISVEQLWNPASVNKSSDLSVLTNYIHSCYYPQEHRFDHVDFSVNQYSYDVYCKKYQDAYNITKIPIDAYGENHYKIWCIKGDNIDLPLWVNLVDATLDYPFRSLFAEAMNKSG